MTLEQLMAFTITQDRARQEQVWEAVRNSRSKEPYQIRRLLTETAVQASDKRVLFVGMNVYEAAGGTVLRDLFQADGGGWLQDVALLDRLTAENPGYHLAVSLRNLDAAAGRAAWADRLSLLREPDAGVEAPGTVRQSTNRAEVND